MRIAVNAIFFRKDQQEGYGHYANEIFSRLAKRHPEHEFILLFDRPFDAKYVYGPNVAAVLVPPAVRHPLGSFSWYNVKAPAALRSLKVDVWVQPYGFCSMTTRIPQVLMVHDLSFIHFPKFIPWHHRRYYRFFTGRFVKKAKRVIAISEYTKRDLIGQYKLDESRIAVVHGAARDVFRPLSWFEREEMKEAFAAGTEYFISTGGIHPRKNLMTLLKAFSLFKKWQQSNMKLLVVGRLTQDHEQVLDKLRTYRYRDDVVLLGHQSDETLAQLMAGAYAMVYPSYFEGFGLPVLEAMRCEVPVIASDTGGIPEAAGDAALYADPAKPEAIAKHMQHIYRDEILRTGQIEKGKRQEERFSWDKAADLVWEQILQAAGK